MKPLALSLIAMIAATISGMAADRPDNFEVPDDPPSEITVMIPDPLDGFDRYFLAPGPFYNFSCGDLWYLRNRIYYLSGYCFHSGPARRRFGNEYCVSQRSTVLNRYARMNSIMIERVRRARGCL